MSSTPRRAGARELGRLLGDGWRAAAPAYRALAAAVRDLVLDGRLPLGVRLPSERELSVGLCVSRTTVAAAYAELREAGFLVSRRGAGSWTATPEGTTPDTVAVRPSDSECLPEDVIDLSTAALPAPGPMLREAYEGALARLPRHLPGTGYSVAGLGEARRAVADRFTARGLPTTAEQIVVTAGALNAFAALLRVFVAQGDRVLVEHPTYPNALDGIRRAGARVVPFGVGGDGVSAWDVDGLVATVRRAAPSLAYVVPDHHNPTGASLDAAGRAALVAAARAVGTVLVVDETMVELGLDHGLLDRGEPPPPTAVFGPEVVTIGGVSKSHWGGLRLGWLRAPRDLVSRIVDARLASDLGTPVVEQLVLAQLLADPDHDGRLAVRRAELGRRRDAMEQALTSHLPHWRWRRPGGGLSLWAELGRPVSTAMAARAGEHGLRLTAGPRFGLDGAFERFLRVPFTTAPERAEEAARRLAAVADAAARGVRAGWSGPPAA